MRAPALRALLLGLLGAGLALACATPLTQEELDVQLRRAGSSVRGLGTNFLIVPVYAESRAAAWTLMADAKSEEGSLLEQRLSADFARAARRRVKIVVGGPYAGLTRDVVMGALELQERPLPGLTLVYVGDAKYAGEIRTAAKSLRARFYHRELP